MFPDASALIPTERLSRLLTDRLESFRQLRPAHVSAKGKNSGLTLQGDQLKLPGGTSLQVSAALQKQAKEIKARFELSEDDAQVALLLRQYLRLQSQTGGDATSSADQVERFSVFFLEEKLFLLRTISALLRIHSTPSHELHELASSVLTQIAPEASASDFALQCLAHLQDELLSAELPLSIRENSRYAAFWVEQYLHQQSELLELVFLLFYDYARPSAELSHRLLEIVDASDFGRKQAKGTFFASAAAQRLLDNVASQLTLLTVECLSLEDALDADEDTAGEKLALAKSPEIIGKCLDIIEGLQPDVLWGPVLVGWCLLLQRLEAAEIASLSHVLEPGAHVWQKLANLAFSRSMQVNHTIASLTEQLGATSPPVVASPSFLAYRAVAKGLLLAELELVRPSYLEDLPGLLAAWSAVFGNAPLWDEALRQGVAALAQQYWESDAQLDTRSALLTLVTERWPILFWPQLRLLKVLTGRHTSRFSGETSSFQSEAASASSAAVFRHFANLTSLAHYLPQQASARTEYEVLEDGEGQLIYRLLKPLALFGSRSVLPAGSIGRVANSSDQSPVLAIWETRLSGWRLLRDVLASIAGVLRGDADVFGAVKAPSLSLLTPECSANDQIMLVGEGLELFATVLSSSKEQAYELLEHLDEQNAPSMVSITVALVNQLLSLPNLHQPLISAGYTVLATLLEIRPASLWLALRPSNLVVGSPGQLSLRKSEDVVPSTLLTAASASGSYGMLLAQLDFHTALLVETSQSQFSSPEDVFALKTWVSQRLLTWVIEAVWCDCLNWRYSVPSEKLALLAKCLTLFNIVMSDRALESTPLAAVISAFFVREPSGLAIAPLANILACSKSLVEDAAASGDLYAAQVAPSLLAAAQAFSIRLVQRQRQQGNKVGAIEALIFDPTPTPQHLLSRTSKRMRKVQIAAELFDSVVHLQQSEAATLLTETLRSTWTAATVTARPMPPLVTCLGSVEEAEQRLQKAVSLLKSSQIAAPIWNLLAAAADCQPSLATILITGAATSREQNKPSERSSAFSVALESIERWKDLWLEEILSLEQAIKFVDIAWQRASEHQKVFEDAANRKALWDALQALIGSDISEGIDADEYQILAIRRACKARALRLLASAVLHTPARSSMAATAMAELVKKKGPQSAIAITFDAQLLGLADSEGLRAQVPELPLDALRRRAAWDDFDLSRQFNANYAYDLSLLARKLLGFQSIDGENVKPMVALDAYEADQVAKVVLLLNQEWATLDSQFLLLRSWTDALGRAMGVLSANVKEISKSAFDNFLPCCQAVNADRGDDGPVHEGKHREQVELLSILLEYAWGTSLHISKDSLIDTIETIHQIKLLLESVSETALDASLRGQKPTPQHRPLFRMVLLASLRYRDLLVSHGTLPDARQHRELHKYIDSFAAITIKALRISAEHAALQIARRASLLEVESDIELLCSILNLLIRPEVDVAPHFLAETFQASSVLSFCVQLFAAAPQGDSQSGSPKIASALLALFLTLANHPSLSETLVLAGLMPVLSNNTSTPALEAGQVTLRVIGQEHPPQHRCWLLMLRIMASLCVTFSTGLEAASSQHFIATEISSFVALYRAQIERALRFAPVAPSNIIGGEDLVHHPAELEEIEAALSLLACMAEAQGLDEQLARHFCSVAADLLQQSTYLLLRPRQLANIFGVEEGEGSREIIDRMEKVASNCISLISEVSGAVSILCTRVGDLSCNLPVISPVSVKSTPLAHEYRLTCSLFLAAPESRSFRAGHDRDFARSRAVHCRCAQGGKGRAGELACEPDRAAPRSHRVSAHGCAIQPR